MRGIPGYSFFCTRTTVIDRKSVVFLTSVQAYKPGLMPHQLINQYPKRLLKTVRDGLYELMYST
jgi:hypothetical protein